ncbi:hypothetical protein QWY16_09350 [Planococcus shenhongbingii]|uniref:hypothetical protein n=1 Tax=Planococcus shenhongbingii TaxID=3058398 RepID=UPI002639139A|nr:hypothetical protein [Planococcus sp. N016]WKA60289.1 hypothetical protein QWY16_09350 [Planococcus sp. N016]
MKDKNIEITVIDSLMGSGKTSFAIQMMDDEANVDKKYIFITPFLTEVERVISSCKNREFVQPEVSSGKTKQDNLKRLIVEGMDIASTHALFKRADEALIDLLYMEGYTLILDEVMDVLEQEPISKSDLGMLIQTAKLTYDEKGSCKWNDANYAQDGKFNYIKKLAESKNLIVHQDKDNNPVALYWNFPVDVFRAFDEVYVLTYMFDGQIQKYYYDMFNIKYEYKSVSNVNGKYELTAYIPFNQEDRSQLKELINIHYSKLNDVGKEPFAFSSTKLKKYATDKEYKEIRDRIKKDAYNYYRNKLKAPTDDIMWTTIKGDKEVNKKALAPTGLSKEVKGKVNKFVEVNCRATNAFADKSVCIYLVNIYLNPILKGFVEEKGKLKVDQDKHALSELLQWLFRSRIRNNEPIDIYIPSSRMRGLLEQYLDNEL